MADADLEGRVALVTGSSRNLGAEIARVLATSGSRVVVVYRSSRTAAEQLLAELPGDGHVAVAGDVGTSEGVEALVEATTFAVQTPVQILVNNAGPFSMTPFVQLEPREFDHIWNVNVRAVYELTRLLAADMAATGWGRIVNLSAGSAFTRSHSVYTLAKQAVITLTEQLACELGPEITVNCVAPGQIAESADDMAAFDPDFVGRELNRTPAGRLVTRSEVARVVGMLCSDACAMLTGVTIPVDGGARLFS